MLDILFAAAIFIALACSPHAGEESHGREVEDSAKDSAEMVNRISRQFSAQTMELVLREPEERPQIGAGG